MKEAEFSDKVFEVFDYHKNLRLHRATELQLVSLFSIEEINKAKSSDGAGQKLIRNEGLTRRWERALYFMTIKCDYDSIDPPVN